MHIPADFRRQIIATFEQRGADWLDQLPDLIDAYARRWSLSVGPAFPGLSFNYVAPATRADGSPAVLKLGVPRDELCTEIGLDRERIRAWATAFAVLSAWWCLEDGSDSWEYSLTCANLLVQS